MKRLLLSCLLPLLASPALASPALAAYKCESAQGLTYSDTPCPGGKQVVLDQGSVNAADSKQALQRAAQEKKELKELESARHKREANEEKEQKKTAKQVAAQRKKCSALAQKRKWSEEDAASAPLKSTEKAKRKARRATEKYELECSK